MTTDNGTYLGAVITTNYPQSVAPWNSTYKYIYILIRYAQTNIKNLYPNSWCRDKIDNFGVEVYSSINVEVYSSINETLQPKMHSTQIIIPQ